LSGCRCKLRDVLCLYPGLWRPSNAGYLSVNERKESEIRCEALGNIEDSLKK